MHLAQSTEVTQPIRRFPRLAARALPVPPAAHVRPEFLAPAAIALGVSLSLLVAQRWPLTLLFAPTFVLACRYYELARFEPVRPSRLAFLLTLVGAGSCALWALTHHGSGFGQTLALVLAGATLAVALHLFTTQRRLAKSQITLGLLHAVDEDAPCWPCGGPLALLPVVLLMGCLSGLVWWRSPWMLLWGLAAVPVLAAQLRGHAWFPRLAIAWLTAWGGIEVFGAFGAGGETSDDASVSFTVLAVIVAMAVYLRNSPRVRRTFAPVAAPAEGPLAAATATGEPQAVPVVTGARSTG